MKRSSCNVCKFPVQNCLCAALPPQPINNRWPVYILQHRQEQNHALNTARIAMLGLSHCHVYMVDDRPVEDTLPAAVLTELDTALLIYPGTESENVAQLNPAIVAHRPLLLLDASWRKSRRLLLASAWLQARPRITFDLQEPSRYRIRREPAGDCCSSLEALCTVLGSLEQRPQKYAPLLVTMDFMINRQIEQMGAATFRRNYFNEQDDR